MDLYGITVFKIQAGQVVTDLVPFRAFVDAPRLPDILLVRLIRGHKRCRIVAERSERIITARSVHTDVDDRALVGNIRNDVVIHRFLHLDGRAAARTRCCQHGGSHNILCDGIRLDRISVEHSGIAVRTCNRISVIRPRIRTVQRLRFARFIRIIELDPRTRLKNPAIMDTESVIGIAELGDLENHFPEHTPTVGGSRPIQPERAMEYSVQFDRERLICIRTELKPRDRVLRSVSLIFPGFVSIFRCRGYSNAFRHRKKCADVCRFLCRNSFEQ